MTSRSSVDKRKSRALTRTPVQAPGARADLTVSQRLEHARLELLQRTAGTRLLDTPRGWGARTVEAVGEGSDSVFRRLVVDKVRLTLQPRVDPESGSSDSGRASTTRRLFLPEQAALGVPGPEPGPDRALATAMSSADLQKRLIQIDLDARRFEEERGICCLYLALGFLRWSTGTADDRDRRAPLLLVPVDLARTDAQSPFAISYSGDVVGENPALRAMLSRDFGVELPPVSEIEDLVPSEYAETVRSALSGAVDWTTDPDDVVLACYSTTALSMFSDLDPANWTGVADLDGHPVLRRLLCEGPGTPPRPGADENPVTRATSEPIHVLDADSAQDAAIRSAITGDDLVVHSAPGTGASQTIANLVAWAVRERKRVLFVAQKRAALQDVRRRLDLAGLGAACLDLGGRSARPDDVLKDLETTLGLSAPEVYHGDETVHGLRARREHLDAHVKALHEPIGASGMDTYVVAGHLVELAGRGVQNPGYALDDAPEWSHDDYAERLQALARLAAHVGRMGVPADHPWRGVGLSEVSTEHAADYAARARTLDRRLSALEGGLREVASALGMSARHLGSIDELSAVATALLCAPEVDPAAIAGSVWEDQQDRIAELVRHGRTLQTSRTAFGRTLTADVWERDLGRLKAELTGRSAAVKRWLTRTYRKALAEYRAITGAELPTGRKARLAMLDALVEGQRAWRALRSDDVMGRAAFGDLWRGPSSDWDALEAVVAWEREARGNGAPDRFRSLVGRSTDLARLGSLRDELADEGAAVQRDLRRLCEELELDVVEAFGTRLDRAPIRRVRRRLDGWALVPDGIQEWIRYRSEAGSLRAKGVSELTEGLSTGRLRAAAAADTFRKAYFDALLARAESEHPELAAFEGRRHEHRIRDFQDLDLRRMLLSRAEVAAAHHRRIPTGFGGAGETGLLWREIRKRERRLPLRTLFVEAARTIQDLKPVFMMPPAAVARYLEPGVLSFDLLIVDEGSQMRPADALGAIARSRQLVVFGDSEQLSPTRDHDALVGDRPILDEAPEDDAVGLGSLLGLAMAQGLPTWSLECHYRSRHPSLISVSSREFYGDRLMLVPASGRADGSGMTLHVLPEVVLDGDASTTNRQEAWAVAEAVMDHAQQRPHRSLCVGTLAVAQRDAVVDAVERLRRRRPDLEPFFARDREEPFVIESAATLQGTVRDDVLVAVGLARDADGIVGLPEDLLAGDRGARRLNVLFSRARRTCRVFSSIAPSDVNLARYRIRGAAVLKAFLDHAAQGGLRIPSTRGRDPDSRLEDEVAWSLRRAGYTVEHQVGSSWLSVDLAVLHPTEPGVFLLGVLFDGDLYAAPRSARDRDRIRPQLLEERGWTLHRVWSLDWARDRDTEVERLLSAVAAAGAGRSEPA